MSIQSRFLAPLRLMAAVLPGLALALVVGMATVAAAAPRTDAKTPPAVLIAVINRAEWCSVCKANGPRVAKTVMGANADGGIAIVMNDLTTEATTRSSATELRAAGVEAAMAPYTATGVLYLFDARTKRPLRQVTVANTDDEIRMAIALARKQAAGA